MMEKHQMSADDFLKKFPVPADEAERSMEAAKLNLVQAVLPIPQFESFIDEMWDSFALRDHVLNMYINACELDQMRFMALRCKREDGSKVSPPMTNMPGLARKMSMCQHVLSSGEMVCARADEPIFAHVVAPFNPAELVTLGEAGDRGITQSGQGLGMIQEMMAGKKDFVEPPETAEAMGLFLSVITAPDFVYSGAPVLVNNQVVGTFCCGFRQTETWREPTEEQLYQIRRAGLLLGGIIEAQGIHG